MPIAVLTLAREQVITLVFSYPKRAWRQFKEVIGCLDNGLKRG
jgi:hypothetical protein